MPKGNNLVPEEVFQKVKQFSSFIPSDMRKQIKVFENMSRSFSIPARLDNQYVLIVGIETDSPIKSSIVYDLDDLKIITKIVLKALDKLGVSKEEFFTQILQEGESSA